MLTMIYHMLLRQQPYVELGVDYLDHLNQHVRARRLVKQLASLGYNVQLDSEPEVS